MMVRSSAEKLTTDIADLEAVLAKAERPAVRAILDDQLVQLRNEFTTLKPAQGAANPQAAYAKATTGAETTPVRTVVHREREGRDGPTAPTPRQWGMPKLPNPGSQLPKPAAAVPFRAPALALPPPARLPISNARPSVVYSTISSFGWDQDPFGPQAQPAFVYVYITSGVDGVGEAKERVTCDFTPTSFDLKVLGLKGRNLRLLKSGLEKEIVPEESKVIVKKVSLRRVRMGRKRACTSPREPAPVRAFFSRLTSLRLRNRLS